MNCPVCENTNCVKKFDSNNYQILECCECSHAFTDLIVTGEMIQQVYTDNYFFGGKDGYPDYTLEKDILTARGEKYADKIGKYLVPGVLFDVGAAAGFIMKGFENKGWKVSGVEPNASMANYGKKEFGLDIMVGTLESVELNYKVDLILLIQVIAHLYDLEGSMSSLQGMLKKGGYTLIETWNKDSYLARIFGRNWHEYSPPITLNYFSKKSLDKLMNKFGFEKVASGRPKKKIHSKHAKALLHHKFESSKILKWLTGIEKLLPDNWYLPYPSEDLFWALYRKI